MQYATSTEVLFLTQKKVYYYSTEGDTEVAQTDIQKNHVRYVPRVTRFDNL